MTGNTIQMVNELLIPWSVEASTPEMDRLDMSLKADDLLAAVTALTEAHWGCLSAITGIDLFGKEDKIEVLYQFCAGAVLLTLRVKVERMAGYVPSICSVIPCANILERELREMFGVEVVGLPDTGHLFLPDDWPQGIYPLRKDAI